jgi:hypothetical protein
MFKKTAAPTGFDPDFIKYVKSIEIEKENNNPVVVQALRERASLEYFKTSKLS